MTTTWKYTDATQLVVYRTLTNGSMQSCSVEATNYLEWVEAGNTATAADAIPDPTYQENRVAEYPPVADYLDGIVKADDLQVQKYIDDCQAVKDKYPK
tara:strand:- start:43 stop:336 length:294 start_codon:yes stop_codon:yes gene_type:complete